MRNTVLMDWSIYLSKLGLIVVDLLLIFDHLEETDSWSPDEQSDDVLLT